MQRTVGIFWLVLAVLYLVLAALSFSSGLTYDRQIAKAPTMQGTAQGATRFTSRQGMTVEIGGSSGQSDVVVTDLWKDLRAYLNASTWVNFAGFVLAAVAALVSLASARHSSGEARTEPMPETPNAGA